MLLQPDEREDQAMKAMSGDPEFAVIAAYLHRCLVRTMAMPHQNHEVDVIRAFGESAAITKFLALVDGAPERLTKRMSQEPRSPAPDRPITEAVF